MAEQEWGATFASANVSAMQAYDDLLVEPLFAPWGRLLVEDAKIAPGETVCDVACGPGSVTRIAAVAAGPDGVVHGCDISAGMLDVARAKPPLPGAATIEYHEAPAERLPLTDGSVDVLLCQQGLQFFPERAAALEEMRRVLKPGGRLRIAVWGSVDTCPPFLALATAIAEVCGDELAARYRSGPWGFPDPGALADAVSDAAFNDVSVEVRELPLVFPGGADQLHATLTFAGITQELTEEARALLKGRIRDALAPITSEGMVRSHATSNIARATR